MKNVPAPEDSREERSFLEPAEIRPDKEKVLCRIGEIDRLFLVSLPDERKSAFVEVPAVKRESSDSGSSQATAEHSDNMRPVAHVDGMRVLFPAPSAREFARSEPVDNAISSCDASNVKEPRRNGRAPVRMFK